MKVAEANDNDEKANMEVMIEEEAVVKQLKNSLKKKKRFVINYHWKKKIRKLWRQTLKATKIKYSTKFKRKYLKKDETIGQLSNKVEVLNGWGTYETTQ